MQMYASLYKEISEALFEFSKIKSSQQGFRETERSKFRLLLTKLMKYKYKLVYLVMIIRIALEMMRKLV